MSCSIFLCQSDYLCVINVKPLPHHCIGALMPQMSPLEVHHVTLNMQLHMQLVKAVMQLALMEAVLDVSQPWSTDIEVILRKLAGEEEGLFFGGIQVGRCWR